MKLVLALLGTFTFAKTFALHIGSTELDPANTNNGPVHNSKVVDNRNIFSPRMDYDEWTPLGRGDPLKNDPTYDYVPPVLERVHYWMDPSKRTPDPPLPNSGVLILGSSRTEPTILSRLTTPKYQALHTEEPQADSRIDAMSLLDPFFKFMDVSKILSPSTTSYYRPTVSPNRGQTNYPRPPPQNFKIRAPPQALQRPPYTMLMPPPPPPSTLNPTQFVTQYETSTLKATEMDKFQASQFATLSPASSPLTTQTSTTTPNTEGNITTINPTVIANTENVYKPVAIVLPEPSKIHQNESKKDTITGIKNHLPVPEDSSMILPIISMFNSHKKDMEGTNGGNGQDTGEYQMDQNPEKHAHLDHLHHHHYPPHGNAVHSYESEKNEAFFSKPTLNVGNNVQSHNMNRPNDVMAPPSNQNEGNQYYGKLPWNDRQDQQTTTLRPKTTTNSAGSLTTDPMFKHYKQPSKPVRGPFYLIIQGHSKVKTYGASKNPINGFVTSNELKDDDDDDERKTSSHEYYDLEGQDIGEKRSRQSKKLNYDAAPGQDTISDEDNFEVVEGHPSLELAVTFKADQEPKNPLTAAFTVADDEETNDHLESLEEAFGKSNGGSSKKRYLSNDLINFTLPMEKRNAGGRRLLSTEQAASFLDANTSVVESSTAIMSPATEVTSIKAAILDLTPTTGVIGGATPSQTPASHYKKKKTTAKPDQDDPLDLESLIALSDDYQAEDVISYILKQEGQGSGLGNFVSSIFARSDKENEEEM